jgi:hypothetical protein
VSWSDVGSKKRCCDDSRATETRAVRERLLAEHAGSIDRVWEAADGVVTAWPDTETTDRAAVVDPLERRLRADRTLDRLLSLLETATTALGTRLPATPVAAPPYLVVTATGPILRATLSDRGDRLVVELRAFVVDRTGGEPTYRRVEPADESPRKTTRTDRRGIVRVRLR